MTRRRCAQAAALAAALLLGPARAGAQQLQEPRVLLFFQPPPGVEPREMILLYETLLARLEAEAPAFSVLERREIQAPTDDAGRTAAARERGAAAWMEVAGSRVGETLRFRVRLAALSGEAAAEISLERPEQAAVSLASWDEVARFVAERIPGLTGTAPVVPLTRAEITVIALPGTTVTGLSDRPLRIGSEGEARVELSLPGFYRIRATRPGSLPERREVYLRPGADRVVLEQRAAPRRFVELSTLNFSYLGAGIGELAGPFSLTLGLTTYTIAPWLRDEGSDRQPASLPLTELETGVGYTPAGYEAVVRPYVNLSAMVRIVHKGGNVTLEPVAPFGFRPAVGLEVAGASRFRGFADWGPVFYDVHRTDPLSVEAMISSGGQKQSGYLYDPGRAGGSWWGGFYEWWLIDFIRFRVGLRWYW